MNKVWFIFRGDHHLGPFSPREIMRMHMDGKIADDTLLWCEGDPGWRAFKLQERLHPPLEARPQPTPAPIPPKVVKTKAVPPAQVRSAPTPALSVKDELPPLPSTPPELPPLPAPAPIADEFVDEAELAQFASEETQMDFGPRAFDLFTGPDKNEENIDEETPADTTEESKEESELFDFYEPPSHNAVHARAKKARIALIFISVLALLVLVQQFFFTTVGPFAFWGQSQRRMSGLPSEIQQQLYRFSRENAGEFKIALALGQKGQSIWLSSGLAGEGKIKLVLTSIVGQVLSEESVKVESQAEYFGRAALFENFKFIKGQTMVPGRYRALVSYRPTGFWDGVRARWSELRGQSEFLSHVQQFEYLYYLGASADFERALKEYQDKKDRALQEIKDQRLAPLRIKLEYYVTLKELTEKLLTLYQAQLANMKSGNQIDLFTTRYAQEIEPLYRPLTLESKARMEDPGLVASEREAWVELHRLYRSMGDLVSDMQTMTSRRKDLPGSSKERLLRIFNSRATEIVKLCVEKQSELENQIEGAPL